VSQHSGTVYLSTRESNLDIELIEFP